VDPIKGIEELNEKLDALRREEEQLETMIEKDTRQDNKLGSQFSAAIDSYMQWAVVSPHTASNLWRMAYKAALRKDKHGALLGKKKLMWDRLDLDILALTMDIEALELAKMREEELAGFKRDEESRKIERANRR
jgi:hypothetical protein